MLTSSHQHQSTHPLPSPIPPRLRSIFAAAIVIAVAHLSPCYATTISIDWVEQPTFPPSVGPISAAGEELPVIFPEFPALFSDATWRSYLKFTKRAADEADAFKDVKYTPGTVFKHRLFGYRGVIMGSTPTCEASEQWMQQMRVDELPGGRKQPFYWTMVDVRDRPVQTTYVAQCNVVPLSAQVLHPDVASIFRSFDTAVGRYVPLDRSEEDVAKEVNSEYTIVVFLYLLVTRLVSLRFLNLPSFVCACVWRLR
jgi:hemimethylated DNA binding protein